MNETTTCESNCVTVDRALRGIAGTFMIISVILTQVHSENWKYFSIFIGLNLLQSAFTKWCPMMTILKMIGLKS